MPARTTSVGRPALAIAALAVASAIYLVASQPAAEAQQLLAFLLVLA